MTMQIGIDKSERGWELTYAYNGGPACMGPEEESTVYATRKEAMEARDRAEAEQRKWDHVPYYDDPSLNAF